MAIADYLRKLVELKKQLVANLNSMGVAADESEKLNTLVPKVLECKTEQNVEWLDDLSDVTDNTSAARTHLMVKSVRFTNQKTIPGYAFSKAKNLKTVIIGDGINSIGSVAFYNCTSLESVTISASVTNIYTGAFEGCNKLADIYYTGTETQWNAITQYNNWNYNMGSSVSSGTTIHYNYVPE